MREEVAYQCVHQLRALPFVRTARWEPPAEDAARDGTLTLTTADQSFSFRVVVWTAPGEYPTHWADRFIARAAEVRAQAEDELFLFTRDIVPALGRRLVAGGVQFMDTSGNCNVALSDRYVARILTEPAASGTLGLATPEEARLGGVLFALLATPGTAGATARSLAAQAGGEVDAALSALEAAKLLERRARGRIRVPSRQALLDRWIELYTGRLRPGLMLGRFHPRESRPDALERIIDQAFAGLPDRVWGGGAAAARLTGYYRGPLTVVHLESLPRDVPVALQALPDPRGPLLFLRAPSPLGYRGPIPGVAHPLLVFSELMASGADRQREAADDVYNKYLADAA